jgi:hypothetical protein
MSLFGRLFGRRKEPDRDQVVDAVLAFINAETWGESQRVVEARRQALLTDTADQVFVALIEQYSADSQAIQVLEEHRALLARCRRDGIDAAFADHLPASVSDASR